MKRFLVLEAIGDEDPTNSPDATSDDTATPATDEATDTPGFPGANGEDDPGDETAPDEFGNDQPIDENGVADGSADADPLANVDPNEPVEKPDLDDLQTDRLQTLTNEDDVAATKTQKYEGALNSAIDDLDVVATATESLREAIKSGQPVTDLKDRVALLNGIRRRQRYSRYAVSVETYTTPEMALESFLSTFRSLFQAIIKAIGRAIEWLKERVRRFFSETRHSAEVTHALTEEILHARRTYASAFRMMIQKPDFHHENYVSSMTAKAWLTCDGKQPGGGMRVRHYDPQTGNLTGTMEPTYANCFAELVELAGMHQFYASKTFLKFTEILPALAQSIEGEHPYPPEVMEVSIEGSIPKRARPLLHYEGRTCDDGCRMYVADGYLGSMALSVEMAYQTPDSTPQERLANIGRWKVDFIKAQPEIPNSDLRYLNDQEIIEASRMSQELSEELERQRRTYDLVSDYSSELKKLMEHLQGKMDKLTADGEDFAKANLYLELLRASNAVVRNASNVLGSGADYCHRVQSAWIVYLTEIRSTDKRLIGSSKQL